MKQTRVTNKRNFKKKQETIEINMDGDFEEINITEAKELYTELGKAIMYAESNELISSFLRQNGMDEAQVETAISQLNKLRDKL